MIMHVSSIRVRRHNKGILSFGKPKCQLMSQSVCFFRRDLSRFERLADLIDDHFMLLTPTGDLLILPLGQHNLFVHGHRVTLIACNQFTLFGLFRILCIIRPVTQTLGNGFPLVHTQGNKSCR